jgi:hypothetical protein
MLAEQVHRLGQIDRGLAADHVGDAFLPEQVQAARPFVGWGGEYLGKRGY